MDSVLDLSGWKRKVPELTAILVVDTCNRSVDSMADFPARNIELTSMAVLIGLLLPFLRPIAQSVYLQV